MDAVADMHGSSAQQDFDAGEEFGCLEWFGDVIVSTQLQPDHFVDGFVPDGEDQNRGSHPGGTDIPTDIKTTAAREHDVQDDEIKRVGGSLIEPFAAVCGSLDYVTFAAQAIAESGAQRFFIFDQQNAFVHSPSPCATVEL